jgi:phospholipase C
MSRTFVLLMLENRSFDHMLGHLALEGLLPGVEGVTAPLEGRPEYQNFYGGAAFDPWIRTLDRPLSGDLPHDPPQVQTQLARALNQPNGPFTMAGFVEAYAQAPGSGLPPGANPGPQAEPMGIFPSSLVPISSFFARNYCVCDHWFCPVPTCTQPNRTVGFTGKTQIADGDFAQFARDGLAIQTDTIIFDWLESKNVPWRVYYESLPFFLMYRRAWPYMQEPKFSHFRQLDAYWKTAPSADDPKVIILEPTFESVHLPGAQGDDNHAPLPIAFGENLLRHVYLTLTSNSARWQDTVFVVYYDEHGGFWDHVAPPSIPYDVVDGSGRRVARFESMGPRIPGLVVSPWVDPGSVCNRLLDHTSVLQMLADEFTPSTPFSDAVASRSNAGVTSLTAALNRGTPRLDIPAIPQHALLATAAIGGQPESLDSVGSSLRAAGKAFQESAPTRANAMFPELSRL